MSKPSEDKLFKDAEKLKARFSKRDDELKMRSDLRYGEYEIEIPPAYKTTSEVYKSPVIREEGRQLLALIASWPTIHVEPPTPEMQPQSTQMELFAQAAFAELEAYHGSVNEKCASAQVHEKIGWMYLGLKRDFYAGRPRETGDVFADALKMDAYKKESGICSVFEQRFVPTGTAYWTGDVWNPGRFFECKWVDEFELMAEYGLEYEDGNYKQWRFKDTTLPSGYPVQESVEVSERVQFIEYWDRQWCVLLAVNPRKPFFGKRQTFVLDSWEHNWGRVPYFPRPGFETDQLEEVKKFESPLDGLYTEIKTYNRVRTIMSSVSYMTGFAPLKVITKEGNQLILDEVTSKPKVFLEFEPGRPTQLAPGQDVLPVIVSPEAQILQNEVMSSEQRVAQYSLSQIARGVSPGADTANSAISQLRRMQRSSLSQLNLHQARQYREALKFMFQRILGVEGEGVGETVYAFSRETGDQIGISPSEIVTLNIDVKADADQGQDKLIEEKQALESFMAGAISELEYHTRRGKENPEEYVLASALDRLRRSFEPEMFEGIKALFGQSSALARLIAKNRETGDAQEAVPEIMADINGMQQGNGMGEGSAMMPRTEGVRSPALQTTTQPSLEY